MSVEELVEELIDLGVKLDIDQGNLKVIGLQKKDAPVVLPKLKEHKQALIEYTRSLQSNNTSGSSSEFDFELQPPQDFYPLSSAQRRLWVLAQMEGGGTAYNMPSTVYFDEEFDLPVLEKAINAVIGRHEILRTVFRIDSNRDPKQVVLPKNEVNFELGYRDFTSEENSDKKTMDFIESEAYRPFDLTQWPLLRAEVLHTGENNYIFFYNMHHIISDGWSMDVLLNDVMTFYEAFKSNVDPDLAPLKIQYKDFAFTENKRLNSGGYDLQKTFWNEELKGELPLITLPSILRRPDFKTYVGESYEMQISPEITRRLNNYCLDHGASLFTGLLAVWNVLMYRYTGETDLIIGTPVAGRDHPELEQQIGFYINMVPLRNQLNDELSFDSNFEEIRKNTLNAFSNRKFPFDHIVDTIDAVFHPGRNAIFDIILSLQNTGEINEEIDFEDKEIRLLGPAAAKYDLEITFKEVGDFLSFNIITNTAIYSEETVRALMQHFEQILNGLLLYPNRKINEIEFLTDGEKAQLIQSGEYNKGQVKNFTVLDTFQTLVKDLPDKVIASFEGHDLSIKELDEQSNALATELISQGIQKGDFVPICFDRSLEMLIAIVGVLKSGGAYVPLDASQPLERLDFIIEDTSAKLVVAASDYKNRFKEKKVINVHGAYDRNASIELPKLGTEDSAYAIYTSGTTGKPKGVVNCHGALTNRLDWMCDEFVITPDDCLLQKTPYTFDVSVWELLMPLFVGSKLIFAKPEGHKETRYLEQLINREKVTIVHFVPSMLNVFLAELETKCESLKYVVCSGEALPAKVANTFYQKLNAILYNFYGPTEAAIDVTYTAISPNISAQDLITVGKPANNVRIYILNENEQVQPNGVVGEIVIAGIQVAEGYINRPELNKKAFINDPFFKGERAYRTGDLGWSLPNGEIVYVDRKDNQVKIRGNRIELEEIENALTQKAGIEQAVVLARLDESEEKNLIAYLVSENEESNADLRNYLLRKLPAYMVPTYFVTLTGFPLTKNGKVNRKALPNPDSWGIPNEVEFIAPQNEIEIELATIWKNVLKKDRIGLKDNFFDLGGHSLKATQIVSQVYKVLNLELSMNDIFNYPILEEQARLLALGDNVSYQEIEQVEEADSYQLSDGQRRLWVLSQFKGGNVVYNMPNSIELEGDYSPKHVEKAIINTIERHEILRTVFTENGDEVRQQILKTDELDFKLTYLDYRSQKNPKQMVEAYVEADSYKPFDLKKGPLFRATLIQLDDQHFEFYYNLHHIINDGWSDEILVRDIMEHYQAIRENRAANLAPLRIQYKDYAQWQLNQLETGTLEKSQTYWLNRFGGELPILEFPVFKQRPVFKTHSGKVLSTYLDQSTTSQIRAYTKQRGGTMFMVLLASIKALFHRYTGQDDFVVGTPIAGRENTDLENQIGFYVNTLALRNPVSGSESFDKLFEQVRQTTLEAYTHQGYPFDRLVEELNLKRDTSRSPLFDALVVLHNYGDNGNVSLTKEEIDDIRDRGELMSKFELEFAFEERGDYLSLALSYNPDIHDHRLIKGFIRHYKTFLQSIINSPKKPIGELNFLTKEEENVLLSEFSGINTPYPDHLSLIRLFEEQVVNTPENIAVVFKNESITYARLNEVSNQFANYLQHQLGIKQGALVGIKLTRNEWMIAAILGVLKNGGAYVPIDPKYPAERVEYIQKDSKCSVIIDDMEIRRFLNEREDYNTDNLNLSIHPDDLAYVIYTSGSTGKPKGVIIENRNVVSFLTWCASEFKNEDFETVFGVTSICFDLSIFEIFHTLCTGKKLRLLNNALSIPDYVTKEDKVLLNTVPGVVKTLLDESVDLGNVSVLNMAGEPLSNALVNRLRNKKMSVRNLYGPSESTTYSTIYRVSDAENVTIGRPISNTRVYILGDAMQPQPVGVVGEICISGAGLAKGYLNKEELTAEKFISNPFIPEERLYLTGDLGRWLPNGEIAFTGRKDNQVKIRGYRIELGEVERVLETHDSIQQAIALANKDVHGEYRLTVYFTAHHKEIKENIKTYLRERLPNYMIPSAFIQLTGFPLTPNGKVDKKSLSEMIVNSDVQDTFIAPATELEIELAGIWSEILNHDKIGVNDDFYELGGHSIKLIQLTRKYKTVFDRHISIDRLFKNTGFKEHIRMLATDVVSNTGDTILPLSTLRENQPYFFMVPPITGRAFIYSGFAQELKDHFNCYGFNYKGANFDDKPEESILEMAQNFVTEMLKMNIPENNVITILGFSMGATIAFEMVKILEEQGVESHLILVDRAPNTEEFFENVGQWNAEEKLAYARTYLQGLFGELPEEEANEYAKFLVHNMEILDAHQTKIRIKSGIKCIQAKSTYETDAMSGWKAFTSGYFSLEILPVEHDEIFLPENIEYLTNLLTLKYENH